MTPLTESPATITKALSNGICGTAKRKETEKHNNRYDHQPQKCMEWLKYIRSLAHIIKFYVKNLQEVKYYEKPRINRKQNQKSIIL